MKKIFAFLLAALLCFSLVGCNIAKNPKTSDIVSEMKDSISFPEMAEITKENLIAYYDVDIDTIEECSYIIAGSGMTADEVLIVKATSDSAAKKLVTLMTQRRDQIESTAKSYTPSETEKLKSAIIGQNGKYAYYIVTNDNTKAQQILDESF